MKILVSGGGGFIGSHTVDLLTAARHKVMVVDNFKTGKLENLRESKSAEVRIADVTDLPILESAFYDFEPNVVVHLAAQSAISTSIASPQEDVNVNVIGTLNMLKLALKYKVKRFVFSSTSAVYRETRAPLWGMTEEFKIGSSNPYGINKFAAEGYVRSMFPNHLIWRYANVYGPRQRPIGENQVVARALNHFEKGYGFAITGSGKQKRDYIYVEDVARANVLAAETTKIGTYNLCTGRSVSVNDLLKLVEMIYDVPGYGWTHGTAEDPRGDVYLNNWKLQREFGFQTTPLQTGLEKTIQSVRST